MGSKEWLCMWCGSFTESKGDDGLADCDRPECIAKRVYRDDFDFAAGIKWLPKSKSEVKRLKILRGD